MCGIIGIVSNKCVSEPIVSGLKRLEYRGYDSAGIAVITNSSISVRKSPGKISSLESLLQKDPVSGNIGIGHTRWATHGIPNEANSHPHHTKKVAVVHNGIIENYQEIKHFLKKNNYKHKFKSQTDTEVIPVLISYFLDKGEEPIFAVRKAVQMLQGAYALAIIFPQDPNLMIGVRQFSPLVCAKGIEGNFLGSDSFSLAPFAKNITYLEDGDMAAVTLDGVTIYDSSMDVVQRQTKVTNIQDKEDGKGDCSHFMIKEIYEQPSIITEIVSYYTNIEDKKIFFPKVRFSLRPYKKMFIVSCGTSFYAGAIAKFWAEKIAKISTEVEIASEFRYRHNAKVKTPKTLFVFVSQSGETADTLQALRYAKDLHHKTLTIVNAPESSMERASHGVIHCHAGPEIGVASTKAFISQVTILALLVLKIAYANGEISNRIFLFYIKEIIKSAAKLSAALKILEAQTERATQFFKDKTSAMYIGRGVMYPVALEGALKLKELSYIHAEGIAAGELKHGPIALIEENFPVVALCPENDLTEKTLSNVKELVARQAKVILFADKKVIEKIDDANVYAIEMPDCGEISSVILYSVAMQMLAFNVAKARNCDIDKPRNLAKSVTVE